jgi:hypothetical protein
MLTTLAELYAIPAMGPAQPDSIVDIVSNVVMRISIVYTQYGDMSTAQSISVTLLTDLRMDLACV